MLPPLSGGKCKVSNSVSQYTVLEEQGLKKGNCKVGCSVGSS
jgi:hypothetical protein